MSLYLCSRHVFCLQTFAARFSDDCSAFYQVRQPTANRQQKREREQTLRTALR